MDKVDKKAIVRIVNDHQVPMVIGALGSVTPSWRRGFSRPRTDPTSEISLQKSALQLKYNTGLSRSLVEEDQSLKNGQKTLFLIKCV